MSRIIVSVELPEQMNTELQKEAESMTISKSGVIRIALMEYFRKNLNFPEYDRIRDEYIQDAMKGGDS